MEEKVLSAAELVPNALEGIYDKLDELRILRLLEESEREAEKGIWLSHEEVFAALHKRLEEMRTKRPEDDDGYYEVRANAV